MNSQPQSAPAGKVITDVFTGIRPTGTLSVANYVCAVKPTVDLIAPGRRPMMFVADLHALTTHEMPVIQKYSREIILDYIALGLDPEKSDIFIQSSIQAELLELSMILSREIRVSELLKQPALKDKLKVKADETSASAFLLNYPVLMAADILMQRSAVVPVGKDQIAHIELTRLLAERFNKAYGPVFPLPKVQEMKPITVLGLKGSGKMGKSIPEEAIFLNDDPKEISKRISRAETAFEGQMTPALESHIFLATELATGKDQIAQIDEIITRHKNGEKVMGGFKKIFSEITLSFVDTFKKKRAELEANPAYVNDVIERGAALAKKNASETMTLVRNALAKGRSGQMDDVDSDS